MILHSSTKTPLDGLHISGWIGIVLGFDTTLTIVPSCVAREVIDSKALGGGPNDLTFNAQTILSSLDAKVAQFTPILTYTNNKDDNDDDENENNNRMGESYRNSVSRCDCVALNSIRMDVPHEFRTIQYIVPVSSSVPQPTMLTT
jgi:hypothetical protein